MPFISFFNVATGKFLNSFAVCSRFLLDSAAFNPSCLGPYGKLVPRIWAQGHSVLDYSKLDTSLLADAITSLRGDLVGTFYSFSRRFNLLGCKNVIQKESDLKKSFLPSPTSPSSLSSSPSFSSLPPHSFPLSLPSAHLPHSSHLPIGFPISHTMRGEIWCLAAPQLRCLHVPISW